MKKTPPHPRRSSGKQKQPGHRRVLLDNPFFQKAYDDLDAGVRAAKRMTKQEAVAWIRRVGASV